MIEIFGHKIDRETAEAIAAAIIEECNRLDGDADAEAEPDEDDERHLAKLETRTATLLIPGYTPRIVDVTIERARQ